MDWPQGRVSLMDAASIGCYSTYGPEALVGDAANEVGFASAGAVYPAANTAIFVPIMVAEQQIVYHLGVEVTTQSGNLDLGIYDEAGTRLVSAGSTAVAAAGVQSIDITDTTLTPGIFYLAMNCDNTTAAFRRISMDTPLERVCGVQQQAVGALALPATATFATMAQTYIPAMFAAHFSVTP
jgi:hypothetical protein